MNINPMDMLKNAQGIAQMFNQVKDGLKDIAVSGQAGGGMVKVTLSGQLELTGIEIDPIAVDARDVPMLQDLIVAAYHDAYIRLQYDLKSKVVPLLGNLNLSDLGL